MFIVLTVVYMQYITENRHLFQTCKRLFLFVVLGYKSVISLVNSGDNFTYPSLIKAWRTQSIKMVCCIKQFGYSAMSAHKLTKQETCNLQQTIIIIRVRQV